MGLETEECRKFLEIGVEEGTALSDTTEFTLSLVDWDSGLVLSCMIEAFEFLFLLWSKRLFALEPLSLFLLPIVKTDT